MHTRHAYMCSHPHRLCKLNGRHQGREAGLSVSIMSFSLWKLSLTTGLQVHRSSDREQPQETPPPRASLCPEPSSWRQCCCRPSGSLPASLSDITVSGAQCRHGTWHPTTIFRRENFPFMHGPSLPSTLSADRLKDPRLQCPHLSHHHRKHPQHKGLLCKLLHQQPETGKKSCVFLMGL